MMILRPSPGAPVIVVSALICSITTEIVLIGDRYVSGYDASHPELCPGRGSQLQLMMIKRTIWGDLRSNDAPVRDDESKYYVTADQYPDLVFPDYVTGPAYMMTTDVKRRFFAAAVKERYMKLEDVLITGVLAKQVNVERVNAWKFYNKRYDGDWCEMKKFISVHGITSTELLQIWKQIKTHEC
ncbi:beta-1,3-galactosyltransferase 1-like [Plodia interpunctella]|uniref:beta-1,3-galactosyltransferase 1-like n=1 Tax=Plodia interpunctella TaxID=58824 RepID=UPI0023683591|nr:beta-1,3-galactosyltransferase 1-like [Plodia interpunctella]